MTSENIFEILKFETDNRRVIVCNVILKLITITI